MNERLKQLLGQAYDEAVPETWTTLSSEQLGRIYDKFAELIVRECSAFVYNYPEKYLTRNQAREISMSMEEHFGVEE